MSAQPTRLARARRRAVPLRTGAAHAPPAPLRRVRRLRGSGHRRDPKSCAVRRSRRCACRSRSRLPATVLARRPERRCDGGRRGFWHLVRSLLVGERERARPAERVDVSAGLSSDASSVWPGSVVPKRRPGPVTPFLPGGRLGLHDGVKLGPDVPARRLLHAEHWTTPTASRSGSNELRSPKRSVRSSRGNDLPWLDSARPAGVFSDCAPPPLTSLGYRRQMADRTDPLATSAR